jgi:hypothetical protein
MTMLRRAVIVLALAVPLAAGVGLWAAAALSQPPPAPPPAPTVTPAPPPAVVTGPRRNLFLAPPRYRAPVAARPGAPGPALGPGLAPGFAAPPLPTPTLPALPPPRPVLPPVPSFPGLTPPPTPGVTVQPRAPEQAARVEHPEVLGHAVAPSRRVELVRKGEEVSLQERRAPAATPPAGPQLVGVVVGASPLALVLDGDRVVAVSIGQKSPAGVLVAVRPGSAVFRADGRLLTLRIGGGAP